MPAHCAAPHARLEGSGFGHESVPPTSHSSYGVTVQHSLVDTRVGDFVLDRLMASGGMAAVFEGHHVDTGAQVAIKVLSRRLREKKDQLARLLQEGRVICSLQHENVVRVLDYGTAGEGVGYVVMERLAGENLADLLSREGPVEPRRAVFIARQICAGLAAAHARDVFHRDVKPANIMLVPDQRHRDFVKLLDFGIARLDPDDPAKLAATEAGMTLGTPQYMSPEQASAGAIDARSDIYQLGLVLYEMLVGRPPFFHHCAIDLMTMHMSQRPTPLRELQPSVPEGLEKIVLRALAKLPPDRYQSAGDLLAALDVLAARDTSGEAFTTLFHAGSKRRVGNLQLPTLGSPADIERYAHNLSEVLDQVWPGGWPDDLTVHQQRLTTLNELQMRVGTDLAIARAEADGLATRIERRLQPLERAIDSLSAVKAAWQAERARVELDLSAHQNHINDLDARYAHVYAQIESHQSTLYSAAKGDGVNFGELFKADIAHDLEQLTATYRKRESVDARIQATRATLLDAMSQISDTDLQLCELNKSRLTLEAERVGDLARLEAIVGDLDNQHRAAQRALEHESLRLGIAFRRAISTVITRR